MIYFNFNQDKEGNYYAYYVLPDGGGVGYIGQTTEQVGNRITELLLKYKPKNVDLMSDVSEEDMGRRRKKVPSHEVQKIRDFLAGKNPNITFS